MKKFIMILVAITVLFSAVAFGESPSAVTDPFLFSTFSEAVKAANEGYSVTGEGYCVAVIEQDGHIYRAVTFFDEQANELYAAYLDACAPESGEFAEEEYGLLHAYIMKLPVQYTEEVEVIPFSQEELDSMAGKTIGEVMSEPWELGMRHNPEDAEAGEDVVFPMVKGFFDYELVINEPFEVYEERRSHDHFDSVTMMSLKNYEDLTVRCVKYSGLSHNISNLQYQADGTFISDIGQDPEGYDYDLMMEIVDDLVSTWENREPDQDAKEAMIAELTKEHPESADMIRQIVESYH